jgi:hypothetical protein
MRFSDTLGDALRRLEQHLQTRSRGGIIQLEIDDGFAVLRYCPYYSMGEGAGLVCEGVLIATTQVVRELCGPAWVPTEVLVPRRAHGNPEPYRSAFRAPVRFNQEMGALVFPAALLEQPLPYADPITRQNLEQHLLERV